MTSSCKNVVAGKPRDMPLPTEPLPVPQTLPSIDTMLGSPPDAVRTLAFENCGATPIDGTADLALTDLWLVLGAL